MYFFKIKHVYLCMHTVYSNCFRKSRRFCPEGFNPEGSDPEGSNPKGFNPEGFNPEGSNPDEWR